MTYEEIRKYARRKKDVHHRKTMHVIDCGRFAVLQSDKTDAILVDAELAQEIASRRWCIDSGGYPTANFGGVVIRLSELVMALHFEVKPEGCYVDHINHDKLDNRLTNLRFVTPEESSLNMPLNGNNTSGYTGVSKTKNGTYRAYITTRGKQHNLGYYKTLQEAVEARREAENRFGFKTRPGTIKKLCEQAA